MIKFFLLFTVLYSAIYGDSQWKQANGPAGADILFLAKCANSIYVQTMLHGVFHSTDNGESWLPIIITGFANEKISAIASNGLTVYVVVDAKSIYRSIDDGVTWEKSSDVIRENDYIRTITAYKNYLIAVSGNNGVFRSSDGGISWSAVNHGLNDSSTINSICVLGDNVFSYGSKFVGNRQYHAVYRSLDDGLTWSPSDSGIPDHTSFYNLTVSGSSLIASTNSGFFISNDSGASWGVFNTNLLKTDTSVVTDFLPELIILFGGGRHTGCKTA